MPTCRDFDGFFRYSKYIANLLLCVIWQRMIIPINNDRITFDDRNFAAQSVKINLQESFAYLHAKSQIHY